MSLFRHLKKAAFYGLLTGLFFGHIDLIVRIVSLNFEWYEFYLALVMPGYVFPILFIICALVLHLFLKAAGVKDDRQIKSFYVTSIIFFFLLVFLEAGANHLFFSDVSFHSRYPIEVMLLIGLCVLALYVVGLRKQKEWIYPLIEKYDKSAAPKILGNYIFFLFVFIVTCFFVDLYQLNYMPQDAPVSTRTEEPKSPNVILITLDTMRADHLTMYGYPKNTSPNLQKLAEKSVVFENATSVAPWTLPAHASIMTGQFISKHQAMMTHQKLESDYLTLAEILQQNGYLTSGFISGAYCKAKFGVGQGFKTYRDRLDFFEYQFTSDFMSIRNVFKFIDDDLHYFTFRADKERTAPEVNKDVFRWLDGNAGKPFFMFINYFDVHGPYVLGEEFRHMFTDESRDYSEIFWLLDSIYAVATRYQIHSMDPDTLEYIKALYDTEIYYLDYHLGKLFEKLESLGIMDDTMFIITSDHGEEFLDHGGVFHTQTLYEELIHVPFIVYYPKRFAPGRVSERVGNLDSFATILDFLNIPIPEDVDAQSVIPLIEGKEGFTRDYVLSERFGRPEHNEGEIKTITEKRWKLIEMDPPQLRAPSGMYDLDSDPHEKKNLYDGDSEQKNRLSEKLRKVLETMN